MNWRVLSFVVVLTGCVPEHPVSGLASFVNGDCFSNEGDFEFELRPLDGCNSYDLEYVDCYDVRSHYGDYIGLGSFATTAPTVQKTFFTIASADGAEAVVLRYSETSRKWHGFEIVDQEGQPVRAVEISCEVHSNGRTLESF